MRGMLDLWWIGFVLSWSTALAASIDVSGDKHSSVNLPKARILVGDPVDALMPRCSPSGTNGWPKPMLLTAVFITTPTVPATVVLAVSVTSTSSAVVTLIWHIA